MNRSEDSEGNEEVVDYSEETPVGGGVESLEHFKDRFRTLVYGSAYTNSIGIDRVTLALRRLDVEVDNPTLWRGMPVCIYDQWIAELLPEGSLLRFPADEEEVSTVWGVEGSRFVQLTNVLNHPVNYNERGGEALRAGQLPPAFQFGR